MMYGVGGLAMTLFSVYVLAQIQSLHFQPVLLCVAIIATFGGWVGFFRWLLYFFESSRSVWILQTYLGSALLAAVVFLTNPYYLSVFQHQSPFPCMAISLLATAPLGGGICLMILAIFHYHKQAAPVHQRA
jgi:hypothetical protein